MGKKNDNTLVKNASFLTIAALISKIIGMLYKSPLSNTLGNNGMGLFNYAQNVYFILLMIASFSIPQAVSKIMAEKLAFKRSQRCSEGISLCAFICNHYGRRRSAFLPLWFVHSGAGIHVRQPDLH